MGIHSTDQLAEVSIVGVVLHLFLDYNQNDVDRFFSEDVIQLVVGVVTSYTESVQQAVIAVLEKDFVDEDRRVFGIVQLYEVITVTVNLPFVI